MRPMRHREPVTIESPCGHARAVRLHEVERPAKECPDCVATDDRWVHLRTCLVCGHVGCCDSSPNRHATKHFEATGYPIMTSAERGETWLWCFVDEMELSP